MSDIQYLKGERVYHREMGPATIHQDRAGFTYVYIEPDADKGVAVSVDSDDLRHLLDWTPERPGGRK